MRLPGRATPVDWLIVGLGNPGDALRAHAAQRRLPGRRALIERWDLGRPRKTFAGLYADGRVRPPPHPAPRVGVLHAPDLHERVGPLGRARARRAEGRASTTWSPSTTSSTCPSATSAPGWAAGSRATTASSRCKAGFGSPDFARVRIGIGRPDSTDPEIVSAHVLGRWRQSDAEVAELVDRAADAVQRIVDGREAL